MVLRGFIGGSRLMVIGFDEMFGYVMFLDEKIIIYIWKYFNCFMF